jgi:hypothetical protein
VPAVLGSHLRRSHTILGEGQRKWAFWQFCPTAVKSLKTALPSFTRFFCPFFLRKLLKFTKSCKNSSKNEMYLQEIYQSSNQEMFAISLSSCSRYNANFKLDQSVSAIHDSPPYFWDQWGWPPTQHPNTAGHSRHRIRRYSRSVTQASICPRFYKRFIINYAILANTIRMAWAS